MNSDLLASHNFIGGGLDEAKAGLPRDQRFPALVGSEVVGRPTELQLLRKNWRLGCSLYEIIHGDSIVWGKLSKQLLCLIMPNQIKLLIYVFLLKNLVVALSA